MQIRQLLVSDLYLSKKEEILLFEKCQLELFGTSQFL